MFKKTFLYIAFFLLIAVGAFAQIPDLSVNSNDVRFETAVSDGVAVGYNLFIRKKPGMESVMLTEPGGNHALRSMEWNAVNGGERRELSGVALNDVNSRFSILSSTPISDLRFGIAFQLFVPQNVTYGNSSSPAGTVIMNIKPGFRINIRTFDHKYADPTTGKYQNNQFMVISASNARKDSGMRESRESREARSYEDFRDIGEIISEKIASYDDYVKPAAEIILPPIASAAEPDSTYNDYVQLKRILRGMGIEQTVLDRYKNYSALMKFMWKAFGILQNE